jgi:hypothetical protein
MKIYRCHRCGQRIYATIDLYPGLALPLSREAAETEAARRRQDHVDRCPGRRPARSAADSGHSTSWLKAS